MSEEMADNLVRAAGFRNVVAHAYVDLDMARVFGAAPRGPDDWRKFLAITRDLLAQKLIR